MLLLYFAFIINFFNVFRKIFMGRLFDNSFNYLNLLNNNSNKLIGYLLTYFAISNKLSFEIINKYTMKFDYYMFIKIFKKNSFNNKFFVVKTSLYKNLLPIEFFRFKASVFAFFYFTHYLVNIRFHLYFDFVRFHIKSYDLKKTLLTNFLNDELKIQFIQLFLSNHFVIFNSYGKLVNSTINFYLQGMSHYSKIFFFYPYILQPLEIFFFQHLVRILFYNYTSTISYSPYINIYYFVRRRFFNIFHLNLYVRKYYKRSLYNSFFMSRLGFLYKMYLNYFYKAYVFSVFSNNVNLNFTSLALEYRIIQNIRHLFVKYMIETLDYEYVTDALTSYFNRFLLDSVSLDFVERFVSFCFRMLLLPTNINQILTRFSNEFFLTFWHLFNLKKRILSFSPFFIHSSINKYHFKRNLLNFKITINIYNIFLNTHMLYVKGAVFFKIFNLKDLIFFLVKNSLYFKVLFLIFMFSNKLYVYEYIYFLRILSRRLFWYPNVYYNVFCLSQEYSYPIRPEEF